MGVDDGCKKIKKWKIQFPTPLHPKWRVIFRIKFGLHLKSAFHFAPFNQRPKWIVCMFIRSLVPRPDRMSHWVSRAAGKRVEGGCRPTEKGDPR